MDWSWLVAEGKTKGGGRRIVSDLDFSVNN